MTMMTLKEAVEIAEQKRKELEDWFCQERQWQERLRNNDYIIVKIAGVRN